MKTSKQTMVYTNGGDTFKGMLQSRSLKQWIQYGRDANQLYTYKGRHYYNDVMYQVVVFDNKMWNDSEIKTRKDNGFLGIRMII